MENTIKIHILSLIIAYLPPIFQGIIFPHLSLAYSVVEDITNTRHGLTIIGNSVYVDNVGGTSRKH